MAEREVLGERRMSDAEALMWNLEKDPHLSSTFANVTVLDRPLDHGRFRKRMLRAVQVIPRLRQRVVAGFGRLAPPEWRDDPNFDIDFHVRRMALPTGSTIRDLFDFATRFAHDPFDRTRPLWEFVVVEGLPDGQAALVQKMHHTITDGVGGVRMSEQFIDLAPEGPDPEDPPPQTDQRTPPPSDDLLSTLTDTATHALRRGAGIAVRTARNGADLAIHPDKWPTFAFEGVETARSIARQVAVADPAHSPLWRNRTLGRHFDVLHVPFDDAKRAAKALGGSINDFFVTGAARGAGAYHQAKGETVAELRMAMPVSTRSDRSAGGNAFAPSRLLVPAAVDDPAEHFAAVRERLDETRRERALALVSGLAGALNVLPTSVLVRVTRRQVETVDFTTSNVKGAPIPLYIAGAKIEANYPMGPLGGTAFNLTLLSYGGNLNMGLVTDTGAVDDPELLRRSISVAYEELLAAGA